MADEENPPATTETTSTETTPPAANGKTFTQDEVNKLVGKAREDGRKSALKQQTPPASPAPSESEKDDGRPTLKQLTAELEQLKARGSFDKRVAKLNLSDEAADDMFALYQVQKPADLGAWIEAKAKLFGGQQQVSTPPAANNPGQQAPATPPAAAPSAPNAVNPLTSGGIPNLWALSEQQIDAMSPTELRSNFEKILEHGRSQSGAPPKPKASR